MNLFAFEFFNRWWIRQLLNERLRPMFCRSRDAIREGNAARAARCELLFLKLLNGTDCFPFCVEVDPCGLWILDEPSELGWWEDRE